MAEKPKHKRRQLTPEERQRIAEKRRQADADRVEIQDQAREAFDRHESQLLDELRKLGLVDLSQAVSALKSARENRGLTLAQVSEASGISVPALSSLESGRNENPTLHTLHRYAKAIGQKFVLGLVDDTAA